ncbi:unnamed protein product [Pedinophyceae sp. YPF-701]|nr:unnamed protein product [Pedinophyceae sp. YPF-701]
MLPKSVSLISGLARPTIAASFASRASARTARPSRMVAVQASQAEDAMSGKRVLIVGGVAGGASCAARARRNSEGAEIVMFERGPHVSFANCGLPYYIGGTIAEEAKLLVSNPGVFARRFNVEARTRQEVVAVDRAAHEIVVRDLDSGKEYREKYDKLVLAPGSVPIWPRSLPGIDLPGIFSLRDIPDANRIKQHIQQHNVKSAVLVGAGFIGVEVAENMRELGLEVTVVEGSSQILPPLDPEIARPMQRAMEAHGCKVACGEMVSGFEQRGTGLAVRTSTGAEHVGDIVVLGIGVAPNSALAKDAGLGVGARGSIVVDDFMRTDDPDIYAVGDAVQTTNVVTGATGMFPMAGPANRQGRIAADALTGRPGARPFRGVQGTAICGGFGAVAACTGASEKVLRAAGTPYQKVHPHPANHVGYYPGAQQMSLKLLFAPDTGKLLGAQAVGSDGVDRRIDVLAMALQGGMTVFDLEEAELCYAPQFGAAKDPVNMAGFIAANALRGDSPLAYWEDVLSTDLTRFAPKEGGVLVDVREPSEWDAGHVEGAVNMPLGDVRRRAGELPRDAPVYVHCQVGLRGHNATRILRNLGYDARNVTGGWKTLTAMEAPAGAVPAAKAAL